MFEIKIDRSAVFLYGQKVAMDNENKWFNKLHVNDGVVVKEITGLGNIKEMQLVRVIKVDRTRRLMILANGYKFINNVAVNIGAGIKNKIILLPSTAENVQAVVSFDNCKVARAWLNGLKIKETDHELIEEICALKNKYEKRRRKNV